MQPKQGLIVRAGPYSFDLKTKVLVMGIVNITDDSFSGDGLIQPKFSLKDRIAHIQKMVDQGADIIDIGAQSTRPGSSPVNSKEQIRRISPILFSLRGINVPLSIDAYHVDVVHAALDMGVSVVNNINGLKISKSMLRHIKRYNAAIIIMHMRGTPLTMQSKTQYTDLIKDVRQELRESVDFCLDFGIKKDKIIIDPGIGFSKDANQNVILIQRLEEFRFYGLPILIGTSRKSFLGILLADPKKDRTAATAASIAIAVRNGANIVRVHDVGFMKEVALTAKHLS